MSLAGDVASGPGFRNNVLLSGDVIPVCNRIPTCGRRHCGMFPAGIQGTWLITGRHRNDETRMGTCCCGTQPGCVEGGCLPGGHLPVWRLKRHEPAKTSSVSPDHCGNSPRVARAGARSCRDGAPCRRRGLRLCCTLRGSFLPGIGPHPPDGDAGRGTTKLFTESIPENVGFPNLQDQEREKQERAWDMLNNAWVVAPGYARRPPYPPVPQPGR